MTSSSEPTLADVLSRLDAIDKRLDGIDKRLDTLDKLDTQVTELKEALKTLDSRFFDFSMRIVSANSSAFFGVGIALLSAAIAFVVARVSSGF